MYSNFKAKINHYIKNKILSRTLWLTSLLIPTVFSTIRNSIKNNEWNVEFLKVPIIIKIIIDNQNWFNFWENYPFEVIFHNLSYYYIMKVCNIYNEYYFNVYKILLK